jgi:hypothetical protein
MSEHDEFRDAMAIKADAEEIQLAMAKIVSEMPQRHDRIIQGLSKALRGHPMPLCLAALADALSSSLTGMEAGERAAIMLAFSTATLQMAAIRDEVVH